MEFCQGPKRSQPPVVRIHGTDVETRGGSVEIPVQRQEIDPTPKISSNTPAIKRMK
jgi:hypothetical protein